MKCNRCSSTATKKILWAEGRAFVPSCDQHEAAVRSHVEKIDEVVGVKKAGEAAALNAFGLTHGTPKPPPTWSQSWQGAPVKNVQKRVTLPSMSQGSAR